MPTYKGTISLRFQIIWDRNQSSYWQTRCWIHYFSGFWGDGSGIWTSAMEVNGTYIWPDGTHVSGFHTNQPDGNGSCCQYWRGANALDDVNCSARLQFVCEMSFWMEWHIKGIFLKIGQQWLVTICVTNWFWNTELPMMRKEGWGGPDPFYEDKPQSVSLMQVTVIHSYSHSSKGISNYKIPLFLAPFWQIEANLTVLSGWATWQSSTI